MGVTSKVVMVLVKLGTSDSHPKENNVDRPLKSITIKMTSISLLSFE